MIEYHSTSEDDWWFLGILKGRTFYILIAVRIVPTANWQLRAEQLDGLCMDQ